MEVFYVVVLVLVAGVVPSHGRTESEGNVFNKTQLHESMSNETVSSSKVSYSISYLALQWPKSFCIAFEANFDRQCNLPVPPSFTVHGLWPKNVDCRTPGFYEGFNHNKQISRRTLDGLALYWPSLEGCNEIFWEKEYNRHGSCTFNNQDWYFGDTLQLFQPYKNLISRLNAQGVFFGGSHSYADIRKAVYIATKKWPTLKCVTVGDHVYLLEIRFCVRRVRNVVVSCTSYGNCVGNVLFPRP